MHLANRIMHLTVAGAYMDSMYTGLCGACACAKVRLSVLSCVTHDY